MEKWEKILDEYYEVSSLGKIRRLKPARNGSISWVGKELKGYEAKDGYVSVCLHCGDTQRNFLLHILVAKAFLGPCPEGKEVNHIDGVKRNCAISNLEYVTRKENHEHAVKLGLKAFGSHHGRAKLSEDDVIAIRKADGIISQSKLAKKYGVTAGLIANVMRGTTWRHLPPRRLRHLSNLERQRLGISKKETA